MTQPARVVSFHCFWQSDIFSSRSFELLFCGEIGCVHLVYIDRFSARTTQATRSSLGFRGCSGLQGFISSIELCHFEPFYDPAAGILGGTDGHCSYNFQASPGSLGVKHLLTSVDTWTCATQKDVYELVKKKSYSKRRCILRCKRWLN